MVRPKNLRYVVDHADPSSGEEEEEEPSHGSQHSPQVLVFCKRDAWFYFRIRGSISATEMH